MRPLALLLPVAFALSLACAGGKDGADDTDVADGTTTSPHAAEGDDAGECGDGADNDGNGAFDCDDAGCAGSPACEESDTDTDADTDSDTDADSDTDSDTDADVPFGFAGDEFSGDCSAGVCTYRMTTLGEAGSLEVDITETDDSSGYYYSENHTGFTLEQTNRDGTYTYRLDLEWVTDMSEVVTNESTLFNPLTGDGFVMDRSTWYFGATSADGTEWDCRVTGDDPSWYADWCTHVAR